MPGPPGFGNTSTRAPTLHPGGLHPGPSVPFALRGSNRGSSEPRRKKWNDRHHITHANIYQDPNTRTYFDRDVPRLDLPKAPRRRLRPTWRLDVPEDATEESKLYRTWDAWHARWKDQWHWVMEAEHGERTAPNPPKVRTPRQPTDLKAQREKEAAWDRHHATVFSRNNHVFQPNFRSYFDRWKDDVPADPAAQLRDVTWKLGVELKPLHKSYTAPQLPERGAQRFSLPGQKPWVGNFAS